MTNKPYTVVVQVRGGVVEDVWCSRKDSNIIIVDRDVLDEETERENEKKLAIVKRLKLTKAFEL